MAPSQTMLPPKSPLPLLPRPPSLLRPPSRQPYYYTFSLCCYCCYCMCFLRQFFKRKVERHKKSTQLVSRIIHGGTGPTGALPVLCGPKPLGHCRWSTGCFCLLESQYSACGVYSGWEFIPSMPGFMNLTLCRPKHQVDLCYCWKLCVCPLPQTHLLTSQSPGMILKGVFGECSFIKSELSKSLCKIDRRELIRLLCRVKTENVTCGHGVGPHRTLSQPGLQTSPGADL